MSALPSARWGQISSHSWAPIRTRLLVLWGNLMPQVVCRKRGTCRLNFGTDVLLSLGSVGVLCVRGKVARDEEHPEAPCCCRSLLLCRTFPALQVPQRIAVVVQGALHERPPFRALGRDLLPLLADDQD